MNQLPKSLFSFFWAFIKKQPISFLLFFMVPISMVLETNLVPYALKVLIDKISYHQNDKATAIREALPAAWLGLLAWVGFIIITRLQNWWQTKIIPTFEADVRTSVLSYVILHSYDYFSNQLEGSISSKINDLPRSLESIRMILCWNVISTLAVVLVTLIITSVINLTFAIILGGWIIIHLVITSYFVKLVNELSEQNAEDKAIVSGSIVDTISNIISVKLFSNLFYELKYFTKQQNKEKQSNKKLMQTMNIFQLSIDIPVTMMLVSTVYYLVINWQQDIISIGDFIFIFNMIFSVTYHMWHLSNALIDLFRQIGQAKQALKLITELHQVSDHINSKPLFITNGEVVFDNVTFKYHKSDVIFKDICVRIASGQKVGLVGYSGSGKSTFVNIILRFFDLESGSIKIDNQDISKVTQDSLRRSISVIPQDVILFHRTIIENIRYGRIDATDEEVIRASKDACCHDFITKLPQGYNSLVGERGIKLSGGQRQRIAIARAILKNAPILILDEATSALDSITEKSIQLSLQKLMYKRTVIVIAHRLSTLFEMDRIIVFNKGTIIEDGVHNELLRKGGHYANMWKMQLDGFLPQNHDIE